jgi:hypothetical protein
MLDLRLLNRTNIQVKNISNQVNKDVYQTKDEFLHEVIGLIAVLTTMDITESVHSSCSDKKDMINSLKPLLVTKLDINSATLVFSSYFNKAVEAYQIDPKIFPKISKF